jgi:YVTN family beta-propeller protein
VLGYITLPDKGIPQDIRVSPDGKVFYVADLSAGGVHLVDGEAFKLVGFIKTGRRHRTGSTRAATRPSSTWPTAASRGSAASRASGKGSVAVIDFATRRSWPPGRSPRPAARTWATSASTASTLWLSGRYDNVVYVIDTTTGEVKTISVGREPHGLTVWPQPWSLLPRSHGQHALAPSASHAGAAGRGRARLRRLA